MNYDCPMLVIKQANGLYRWYGASSVNALDRDNEIVSETAMHMDVYRTRMYGDDSSLNVFHIYDDGAIQKTRIGGAPDYRSIVDGYLIETGEFDDTPLGRGFAKFMQEHPESTDGSGWGMSIGFFGMPDRDKTYRLVEIKERSVLPLSEAANPYTSFGVKELSKMALNDRQVAFLDTVKEMATDAETREAVKMILAATDQSKALNEAGVQRKAATTQPTLSADKPNVATQLGFTTKQTPEEDAALAAAAANLEVAAGAVAQAQDAVSAVATAEPAEDAAAVDPAAVAEDVPTTTLAEGDDAPPPEEDGAKPADGSDEMLKQIAKYVDDRINAAMEEMKALVGGSAKSIAGEIAKNIQGSIKELQSTAMVKAYNEEPAPSILDRLHAFSATKSATTVDKDAPERGANLPTDDEYVSNIQLKLGFEPQK